MRYRCVGEELQVELQQADLQQAPARLHNSNSASSEGASPPSTAPHIPHILRPNCAYVVSGGLGGLGEALVQLLLSTEASEGCR